MTREEIVSRIKKLLSVSTENGATENEAIQAALMAQRLIAENDIKKDELHEDERDGIVEVVSNVTSAKTFSTHLANIVAENFRCLNYVQQVGPKRRTVVFYGYETDARAAQLTFEMLFEVGNRKANEARRIQKMLLGYPDGAYNSFAIGFLKGVSEELAIQTQALMLVTPQAVKEGFAELTKGYETVVTEIGMSHEGFVERGRRAAHDAIQEHRFESKSRSYTY